MASELSNATRATIDCARLMRRVAARSLRIPRCETLTSAPTPVIAAFRCVSNTSSGSAASSRDVPTPEQGERSGPGDREDCPEKDGGGADQEDQSTAPDTSAETQEL